MIQFFNPSNLRFHCFNQCYHNVRKFSQDVIFTNFVTEVEFVKFLCKIYGVRYNGS